MSDMSQKEQDDEYAATAPWGEEDKRLRAIRDKRRAAGECIMCGKPLGFFDKRAKRAQHEKCETFKE